MLFYLFIYFFTLKCERSGQFANFQPLIVLIFLSSRSGWWLLQTSLTWHVHGDSICPRLHPLHQHSHGGTSWSHTGAFNFKYYTPYPWKYEALGKFVMNYFWSEILTVYPCFFFQLNFYLKRAPKQNLKGKPHKKNFSSAKAPLKLGPRWDTDYNLDTHSYINLHTETRDNCTGSVILLHKYMIMYSFCWYL